MAPRTVFTEKTTFDVEVTVRGNTIEINKVPILSPTDAHELIDTLNRALRFIQNSKNYSFGGS